MAGMFMRSRWKRDARIAALRKTFQYDCSTDIAAALIVVDRSRRFVPRLP